MQHISRDENIAVNELVQQALGFRSNLEKIYVLEKSDVPVYQTGCSDFWLMQSAEICSAETDSIKSDGPVSESGYSKFPGT
jgi:hypothetical protein